MMRAVLSSLERFGADCGVWVVFCPNHAHQSGGRGLTDAGDSGLHTFRQLVSSLYIVGNKGVVIHIERTVWAPQ